MGYDEHLFLFGGEGHLPPGPAQPGAEFVRECSDRGYSNDCDVFDIRLGKAATIIPPAIAWPVHDIVQLHEGHPPLPGFVPSPWICTLKRACVA